MTQQGVWESPITADMLTVAGKKMDQSYVDKVNNKHYLLEGRPTENGRVVLVDSDAGKDVFSDIEQKLNLSSSVHEYGGGAVAIRGGVAVFVDRGSGGNVLFSSNLDQDQELKVLYDSATSIVKTNFADFEIHPTLKFAVCVREVHKGEKSGDVVNTVSLIMFDDGKLIDLVAGDDFYSCPRFSPSGTRLSWISWNHPAMQWRDSSMYAADFLGHCLSSVPSTVKIAPAFKEKESISKTVWGLDDETVFYSSDANGYYNIVRYSFATKKSEKITNMEADFSSPDWVFGYSTFDLLSDGKLVATYTQKGEAVLAIVDPELKSVTTKLSEGEFASIESVRTVNSKVYFVAKSATAPNALYTMDTSNKELRVLRKSAEVDIDLSFISSHQHLEFPTKEGGIGHMIYYAPMNPNYTLSSPPPLLVHLHGGPTSHSKAGLNMNIQYWTTRGYAYVDVNYGGSSSYGKAYLERLDGKWGIVDVEDTCAAALHLVKSGLADKDKLCVDGGSAGTSQYGVCSLESLSKLTHKFEAHYLTSLLGGTLDEIPQVYHDRSPINFAHNIKAALLVQQGSIDRVVPPNQAELIVDAVKKQGGVVEYQLFEGEGHGFRRAENIKAQFEKELEFYQKVLEL